MNLVSYEKLKDFRLRISIVSINHSRGDRIAS